jgi:hypothetical protein
MQFFPVFVYTEPRSAKLQPRPVPPACRGDHPTSRGSPDSDRGGQVAPLGLSSCPFPSFNPFAFKRLHNLLRNGRLQLLSFQALPDSFHCNGGVPPPKRMADASPCRQRPSNAENLPRALERKAVLPSLSAGAVGAAGAPRGGAGACGSAG